MQLKVGILAAIILLGVSGCSKEKEAVLAENPVNPPVENRKNFYKSSYDLLNMSLVIYRAHVFSFGLYLFVFIV